MQRATMKGSKLADPKAKKNPTQCLDAEEQGTANIQALHKQQNSQ
jgi:hypothetical protein